MEWAKSSEVLVDLPFRFSTTSPARICTETKVSSNVIDCSMATFESLATRTFIEIKACVRAGLMLKEPNKIIRGGIRATRYDITRRGHSLGYSVPIVTCGVSDSEHLLSIGRCVRVAMTLWKTMALRGFGVRQRIEPHHVIYGVLDYWRIIAPTIGRRDARRYCIRVLKFIGWVEPGYIIPCRSDTLSVMWLSASGVPT